MIAQLVMNINDLKTLFPSTAAAILFGISLLLWLIAEIIGGTIIPEMKRRGAGLERKRSLSNILCIFAWVLVFVIPPIFRAEKIALFPDFVTYIGSVLILLGIVIRQWAIAILGRYFSNALGIQQDQKVVQNGPYRLIRHPSYAGNLLVFIGFGLAFQSWLATIIDVCLFAIFFGYRILSEEKILKTELGNNYIEYMKKTKRIIPFII